MNNVQYTNEALKIYEKYMVELRAELRAQQLSDNDVKSSVQEIAEQIADLCEYSDKVVTTDVLKSILAKMGSPREIARLLKNESKFINDVQQNSRITSPSATSSNTKYTLQFTAKRIARINSYLHSVFTLLYILLIFTSVFSLMISNYFLFVRFYFKLFFLLALIYGAVVFLLYRVHKSGKLSTNLYLQTVFMPKRIYFIPTILIALPAVFYLPDEFNILFFNWYNFYVIFPIFNILAPISIFVLMGIMLRIYGQNQGAFAII